MHNRSEILSAAWSAYRLARPAIWATGDETGQRRFLRPLFSRLLRTAWENARKAALHADHEATARAFVEAQRRSHLAVAKAMTPGERSAAIVNARADLALLDYAPLGVRTANRRAELRSTLDALTAA
ncbi:MAG: hypothetical protein J0I48_02295 [Devosia sp.]|uniref:hypothetical protein n=1 Tax=Devosia sp. 66-22 TaxID=1895753 RepID=UPI0009261B8B|nr:hypothetical protein [Devosia sp. 66-22]MBN9345020.1 hypothetical protein [Devosia sp.]OJX50303.1 MAG: hypothetical protein BGO81_04265 [Devosia sp. 66-22]